MNYLEQRCLQMLATLKHQYGKAEPPEWAPYVIHHASANVFRGGAMALLSSCDTECGKLLRKHGVKNLRRFAHTAKTTEEAIELIQKAIGLRFLRIED